MRTTSPIGRRVRLLLTLSTALGGIAAYPAAAQQTPPRLPTGNDVEARDPNGLLTGPIVTSGNRRLDVYLRSRNTVIDWDGFNIPENNTAHFEDARGLLGGGQMAVLNRDTSGNVSQLLGNLTSDRNVSVFVYNPNGIVVGANAVFNTGSLVLSTLEPIDFEDGGPSYRFAGPATRTAGITVRNGATINVGGGNRGLVMVAPAINADGDFNAPGQDVAFVTATDVTLRYDSDSPLSITLNRGTAVAGRTQYVRGTVDGNNAIFALASQGTVTDSLLQVDASVTTAAQGSRGIVLAAGRSAEGGGVTIGTGLAQNGGAAGLRVDGVLTVEDSGGSAIRTSSNGSAVFTGALRSDGDVRIVAGGEVDVASAVDADGAFAVSGQGVTLGRAAETFQRGGRGVAVTSVNGDLAGRAGLRLSSDDAAAISLSTTGTAAGDIAFAPGSRITAGEDLRGTLTLGVRDAANTLSLGDVVARNLRSAVGGAAAQNRLASANAVTLGDVRVRDTLAVDVAGLDAGDLASFAGITIDSTGAVEAGSLTAGGFIGLTGTGATTVEGAIRTTGGAADVSINRAGAVRVADVAAGRDVLIGNTVRAPSVAVTGAVDAGRNYSVTADAVTLGGGTAVAQSADGAVTITGGAGGITGARGLTLTSNADGIGLEVLTLDVGTPGVEGAAALTLDAGSTLRGGPARQSDVRLRFAEGASAVTLGKVEARALAGAVGTAAFTNGLTRTGTLTTGDILTNRALPLTAAAIRTGALAGTTVTADAGTGALQVGGDITATGALTLSGGSVTLDGARASARGAIDIRARTGGITATAPLRLSSSSTSSRDFVRLQAGGAEGIDFADGSAIAAGANRALRVGVFNAVAGAPLSLGDVSARSLGLLSALDADAGARAGAIVADGSLSFGRLDLIESFTAQSLAGDLEIAGIAVTGANQGISLNAAGTLTVQNEVSSSGDVTLGAGAALKLGTVESRDGRASVTSGAGVELGTLAGARGVSASGTTLSIDTVRGGAVSLVATTGDAELGAITGSTVDASATAGALNIDSVGAGGAVTLTGATGATVSGLLASGGAVRVTATAGIAALNGGSRAGAGTTISGGAIALGGVHEAAGGFAATASAGGITAAAGTGILSNSDGSGSEGIGLTATGGAIAFDAATALGAGRERTGAVTLTTDGGGVAVGAVAARRLDVTGVAGTAAIRTGELRLSSGLSLAAEGGVTTGGIQVGSGGVRIDAGGGQVETGAIGAAGTVSLRGGGVSAGRVAGTSVSAVASDGDVSLGEIVAGDAVDLRAARGEVSTGNVTASALTAEAGAAVTLGELTLGGAAVLTGTSVAFGDAEAGSIAASASDGDITGGRTVARGGIAAQARGNGRGGAITLTQLTTTTGDAALTASGAVSLGDVSAGGAVSLTGERIGVGTVQARRFEAAAQAGDITGGDVTAAGGIAATAAIGTIGLGRVDAATGDVVLDAGGGMVLGGVVSGGSVTLAARSTALDLRVTEGVRAVGAVSVSSEASIRAPFIRSTTGALTVRAPRGSITGLNGIDAAALAAGPGQPFSIAVGTAAVLDDIAGGDISIEAPSISVGAVDAGTRAIALIASNGDLRVRGDIVAGDVTLGATGLAQLAGITAGGAVAIDGGAGVTYSNLSGATVRIGSGGTVAGGDLTAGGAIDAVGGTLALGVVRGGSAGLRATGGDLTIRSLVTGGDAALAATGVAAVREGATIGGALTATGGGVVLDGVVSATGAVTIAADDTVGFADLSGATVRIGAGGVVSGGALRGSGGVDVVGGGVSIDAVESSGGAATLTAEAGDLTIRSLVTGGDAALAASGVARVREGATVGGALSATGGDVVLDGILTGTGAVAIDADDTVGFADLSGTSVRIGAGGTVSGGALRGSGGVDVAGGGVSIDAVESSGGAATLTAEAGDLTIRSLVTGGDAALAASGVAAVREGATVGGALTVTGGEVVLDGVVTGTGAVAIDADDSVGFADLNGATVRIGAGGVVSGGALRGSGGVDVAGSGVSIDTVESGGAATLSAGAGDLGVRTLTTRGDATITGRGLVGVAGAATIGGAYRVTGARVALGGAAGVAQRAAGSVTITASAGDIIAAPGLTLGADGAGALVLDAAGGIGFEGAALEARGATLGLRAGGGQAVRLGTVDAAVLGGYDGTVAGGAFAHTGAFATGDLTLGSGAVTLSAGDLAVGNVVATGDLSLRNTGGTIATADMRAGTLTLAASGGLTAGAIDVAGAAALEGASLTLGELTAGTLTARTAGALAGRDGGRVSLTTSGGDLTLDMGEARLESVRSAGAATIAAGTLDVAGVLSSTRALLAEARAALSVGSADAGGTMTLNAGGALTAGALDAAGALAVAGEDVRLGAVSGGSIDATARGTLTTGALDTAGALTARGAGVTIAGARAGGTLAVTSTGALTLGASTSSGAATLDAGGLLSLGGLTGAPSLAIVAQDAELSGAVQAGLVTVAAKTPAGTAIRLGDGVGGDGLRLSNTEVARIAADTLRVDAGAGALELGTLALAPAAGRTIDLLGTGDVRVTGVVTGGGAGRTVRVGGANEAGGANARTIRVVATSSAGGRLLFDDAALELRGDRIAVGLGAGFVDTLSDGPEGIAQAAALLGSGNSALYNSQLGGGAYDPAATTTLSARTLTVRFGDYALIQNTAVPGRFSGVVLGGTPGAPATPALRVSSTGSLETARFALFGTINGIDGAGAALLGNPVIDIQEGLLANSRINGCLAGSGAGCITTIVIQPTLQVFNWDSAEVFGISQDVAVPFAPIVGGNNEELLSGLPELAPPPLRVAPAPVVPVQP